MLENRSCDACTRSDREYQVLAGSPLASNVKREQTRDTVRRGRYRFGINLDQGWWIAGALRRITSGGGWGKWRDATVS